MRQFLGLCLFVMLFLPLPALGAEGSVSFSQIKTRGSAAGDEFIELFNAGSTPIELNGYKLVKETASGTAYTVLSFGNVQILPQSFLLLALESSSFASVADIVYKTALADNNTLKLFDASQSVVDQLAWGEAQALANHEAVSSYQRTWQQASDSWSPWTIQMFNDAHSSGDLLMTTPVQEDETVPIVTTEPEPEPISTDSVASVSISEIQLLVPLGDIAWMELFAYTSGTIDGWKLMMDGVALVDLQGSVTANEYRVIPLLATTLLTGSISLQNPAGATVQTISIPLGDVETRSYAISSASTWSWTDVVTAGRPNVLRLQDPVPACVPTTESPEPTSAENPVTPVSTAPTAGQITINEVFANPSGDENAGEFIELANADAFEVSLLGWIIADASKQSTLPDLRVPANGFLTLRKAQTGLTLNNTNETLRLINASGQTMTAIAYEAAAEDVSWNAGNPWYEAAPSPGAPNTPAPVLEPAPSQQIVAEKPVQDAPLEAEQPTTDPIIIDDVEPVLLSTAPSASATKRAPSTTKSAASSSKAAQSNTFSSWPKVKANSRVQIIGVVSVPPGVFGDKVATIQDVTGSFAGIELYFSAAAWPELEMGDIIEAAGKKSTAKLGDRLLISSADDITILDHINLDPLVLPIGDLGSDHHRVLVAVDSRVVDQSRGVLDLSDDTGELRASLNKADLVWEEATLPATGFLTGIYVHAPKPELWLRHDDDMIIETIKSEEKEAMRATQTPEKVSIEATSITAAPATTPDSPWLAPLAAAGSAGGLGWYFFQDQLRQHGGKLIERLRK